MDLNNKSKNNCYDCVFADWENDDIRCTNGNTPIVVNYPDIECYDNKKREDCCND